MSALLALLIAAGLFSQRAGAADVELVRRPDRAYEVDGHFNVSTSTGVVWDVITDYEGIPLFVRSMKTSRVREARSDGSLLVEQTAVGSMFFLSKTLKVLLLVRRGPESLVFTDVGRDDFWIYDGAWKVRPQADGGGVRVDYHLLAQPDFLAPSFFLSRAMRRGVSELLDQVRAEMTRRGSTK